MTERRHDRRRIPSDLTVRPRQSPANILILVVIGVLGATAAAAVLFGTGLEETTPHGRVLTSLQRLGDAQEAHYRETGAFAEWMRSLDIDTPEGIKLDLARADRSSWEGIATHPAGLTCVQEGTAQNGQPQREPPICYATAPE